MAQRRHNIYHFMLIVILSILIFYIIYVGILNIPIENLNADNMLIDKVKPVTFASYSHDFSFKNVQWSAIEHMFTTLLLIVFLAL